jgi:hypothetical protein
MYTQDRVMRMIYSIIKFQLLRFNGSLGTAIKPKAAVKNFHTTAILFYILPQKDACVAKICYRRQFIQDAKLLLVSLPSPKFARPPCCDYGFCESKNMTMGWSPVSLRSRQFRKNLSTGSRVEMGCICTETHTA